MKGSSNRQPLCRALWFGLASLVAIGVTGCQVDVGGQTLPSPYYLADDVQYFPPGPKFKCAREAAAMKAAAAQEQPAQQLPPQPQQPPGSPQPLPQAPPAPQP